MFFFKSHKAILEEALPFQGDLVHLLEEPLPKGIRGSIHFCIFLFFSLLFGASIYKVDVVVNGRGKLTYDAPPIVLQAYERAVLRSLKVKPGDTVVKGQVLATLDPTFSQADLSALETRRAQINAQISRITAELSDGTYSPDTADGESAKLQLEIFKQRQTEFKSRVTGYDEAISEAQAGLNRLQSERGILQEQFTISTSIEEMQENLFQYKTNSKLEYLAAKSSRLRAERDFKDAVDRLVELKHHIETVQSQKDSFLQEWRRGLFEELARLRTEESQVAASLTKSTKINSLVVITAPEDGTVLDIANRSVGSIIRDTEPMVVLVPSAAPLLCEIELGSSDIGDVGVGDPVVVKVDAFPFQRFGGVSGNIRSIGYESHAFGGAQGDLEAVSRKGSVASGGIHKVVVQLNSSKMEKLPPGRSLFPGMTVVGEVHVGKRRLISYLLFPLIRGLQGGYKES